jgi:hypothetical protein
MNVRLTSAGVDRVGTLVLGLQPKKNGKGNPNRRGYSASSLAGTWRSQLIIFIYQDCEMNLVVGAKSRSITKAHCFSIDETFHQRFAPTIFYSTLYD